MSDHEEAVQHAKPDGGNREEVHRGNLFLMGFAERPASVYLARRPLALDSSTGRSSEHLAWPVAETDTHWITMGLDKDLHTAMTLAARNASKFLAA